MRLYVGETYRPTVSAEPAGAVLGTAYWSSSNTNVVTVNSTTGWITAVSSGTATVTVVINTGAATATGTCSVSVFSGTPPVVMGETYHIFNANSTKPISPREGNVVDGGQVAQENYRPSSASYQKWKVIRLSNGYYVIRSAQNTDMALSGSGSSLKLSDIGPSNNYNDVPTHAQWTLSGSGEVTITTRSTGKRICIEGDVVWSGENILVGNSEGSKSVGFRFIKPSQYVPTTGVTLKEVYLLKNGSYICMPQITPSNATFKSVIWSWESRGSTTDTGITMTNYDWGTSTASYTGTVVVGLKEGTYWLRAYCSDTNYNDTKDVNVHFLESGQKYFIHNRAYDVNIEDFYQTIGGNARCNIKQISDAQRFTFSRDFYDGYITIRNCETNCVLGVANNSTAHDTIVQFREYDKNAAGQKFKIETAEEGYVYILPKTGEGSTVKALNANYETVIYNVRQKELNSHHAFQWEIRDYNWEHTIKHYVDRSYPVYNGETMEESMALIEEAQNQVGIVMREVLGVKLNYTIENGYNYSKIDQCKGEGDITYADCNELCTEHLIQCHSRDAILADFVIKTVSDSSESKVLWSNYLITSINEDGSVDDNRSVAMNVNASSGCGGYILLIKRRSPLNGVSAETRLRNITGTLLHEIAHLYAAPDHYHTGGSECDHKSICSICGDNKRPASCIMYSSDIHINYNNLDDVFCPGCLNDMSERLNFLEMPSL